MARTFPHAVRAHRRAPSPARAGLVALLALALAAGGPLRDGRAEEPAAAPPAALVRLDDAAEAARAGDFLRRLVAAMERRAAAFPPATAVVTRTTRLGRDLAPGAPPLFERVESFALRVEGPRFHLTAIGEVRDVGVPPDAGALDGSREVGVVGDGAAILVHKRRPLPRRGSHRQGGDVSVVHRYLSPADAWTPDALLHPWDDGRLLAGAPLAEALERQLAAAGATAVGRDGAAIRVVELAVGAQRIRYEVAPVHDPFATPADADPVLGGVVVEEAGAPPATPPLYRVTLAATTLDGHLVPALIERAGWDGDVHFTTRLEFRDWRAAAPSADPAAAFDLWALAPPEGTRVLTIRGDGEEVAVEEVATRPAVRGGAHGPSPVAEDAAPAPAVAPAPR